MHPQEERLAGGPVVQPGDGAVDRIRRLSFRILAEFVPLAGPRHFVVVNAETVVETEQLFQHGGADERGRVPPLLLENARQRMRGGLQNEAAGVSHIVNRGVLPGEDAGVRGRRQRRLRHRVLEQDAALREAVQGRRLDVRISVAVQMIGAKRVDGDDHDVERTQPGNFVGRTRSGGRLGMAAGEPRRARARHTHRRRGLAERIWSSI